MEEGTTGRWVDRGLQSQIPMGRASGFEAGGTAIAHSLRPSKPFLSHFTLVANVQDPYPKEIWGQSWMPATKLVFVLKRPVRVCDMVWSC